MKDIPGPLITASGDKRITRFGRMLRRTNFDELPQFVNIFKGDLSVVGPRPEIPEIVATYTEEQREILSFKPGFTSLATVRFLDEEKLLGGDTTMDLYVRNIVPKKIRYDLDYFRNTSNFFYDILIILKTIGKTVHV
jgi:lipopolysaccharide/colanic/teichoic acid biosynthesis glycosyltransferase